MAVAMTVRAVRHELVPLVAEVSGRWHFSAPRLVRQLAKECAARASSPGRGGGAAAAIAALGGARLSALVNLLKIQC